MNSSDILCPICETSSYCAFTTKYHRVHRCNAGKCSHLFAVGDIENIGINSPDTDKVKDYTVYKKRNKHLINYWKRHNFLRDGFSILDFGSGVGHIVKSLKENMSVEVDCVEAGQFYHSQLKKMNCRVYSTLEEIDESTQYDAVLMIEVIEHLYQPIKHLKQIRKHLKRSGELFITTPAGDLRFPLIKPWKLSAHNTPHHIQFFTPKSLSLALNYSDFRNIRYRFVNEMYPNDALEQSDYDSLGARVIEILKQIQYRLIGDSRLTYFAG